ncbi:glucose 1-dehydrogenase [Lactobacillus sp. ESL0681]|uniref:glucose 1-dehydrogenase n=1 Tax=Lactobacillus sp. ESL0681 TaxID=2983211 RepID=UPI0023F88657|nr:glucose 1-dehydrogenase [Lactobacillus sp. ESL0681]WEV39603.1 glucose 1-dehydrogenase [Lactobacillus sp. ESL0681]
MKRLNNKVAIITGGSGGIGMGIAHCYLNEGAKVIITDIRESEQEKALVNSEQDVDFINQDVTDESKWTEVIDEVVKKYGHLDILINCAGIDCKPVPVDQESLEDFKNVLNVNLIGTFLGIKHAMKVMKGKGGSIINIASLGGIISSPTFDAYSASKGGVRLLTKAAALDGANDKYNVRVNVINPGAIKTPMVTPELEKMFTAGTPMGHLGKPEDIGQICTYLGSDESEFTTGAEFTIDGGKSAG